MNTFWASCLLIGFASLLSQFFLPSLAPVLQSQIFLPLLMVLPLGLKRFHAENIRLKINGIFCVLFSLLQSPLELHDLPISWIATTLGILMLKRLQASRQDSSGSLFLYLTPALILVGTLSRFSPLPASLCQEIILILTCAPVLGIVPLFLEKNWGASPVHQCFAFLGLNLAAAPFLHELPGFIWLKTFGSVSMMLSGIFLASIPLIQLRVESGSRMTPALVSAACLFLLTGSSSLAHTLAHWPAAMTATLAGFVAVLYLSPPNEGAGFSSWISRRYHEI